jgi:hypothetical protein
MISLNKKQPEEKTGSAQEANESKLDSRSRIKFS